LKYRVRWSLLSPQQLDMMETVIQNPTPPTDEWWSRNWVLLNSPPPRARNRFYTIFRPTTRFREHWEFARIVYDFHSKLVDDKLYRHPDFQRRFESKFDDVFETISEKLTTDMDSDEAATLYADSKSKLEELAVIVEGFAPAPEKKRSWGAWIRRQFSVFRTHSTYWVWLWIERLKINLFQRWKLRKPRIYPGPPLPPHSSGNEYWLI
jgi:hypothetical protein